MLQTYFSPPTALVSLSGAQARPLTLHFWREFMIYLVMFSLVVSGMAPMGNRALAITPPPTQTGTNAPGKVDGALSVSTTGDSQYSIPVVVPPGSAGFAPQLSIDYSSSRGNGVMGVGWFVSGLDVITRCPRDIVHDSGVAAVSMSTSDRYCINGQRLVLTSGTYGAAGSEYRTERDDLTRYIANGAAGAGPSSFTARKPDGVTLEYGLTSDSKLMLPGQSTPFGWALQKATDLRGNYYSVTYTSSAATGQQRISRIDYTGNASAGLTPYNSVRFEYTTPARSDTELQYVAGSKVTADVLLDRIETYAGASLVKRYQLAYAASTPTGRMRVQSISECGSTGSCLPATTFSWENTAVGVASGSVSYPLPASEFGSGFTTTYGDPGASYWVDLNGDGRPDHCRASKRESVTYPEMWDMEQMWCGLTQPGSAPPVVVNFGPFGPDDDYFFVDFNGDGFVDVCGAGMARCHLMGSAGPTGAVYSYSGSLNGVGRTWVDLDSDGRVDFCQMNHQTGELWCHLGTGTALGAGINVGTFNLPCAPNSACEELRHAWADVTGDGVRSFCRIDSTSARCRKWTGSGLGAEIVTPTGTDIGILATGPQGRAWADFNGDGKEDYCRVLGDGARVGCTLSTGTGFGDTITSPVLEVGAGHNRRWVDINSDGKADFCTGTTTGQRTCTLSKGSAFGTTVTIGAEGEYWDVNGDGKLDVCTFPPDGTTLCYLAGGLPADLLTSVTDGLGATSYVDYRPISDATVYTRGTGSAFPVNDVQDSTHVVQRLRASNGVGGTMDTTYQYQSLRRHVQGRGGLGFNVVGATSPTGVTTWTQYMQTFPYTGEVERSLVLYAGTTVADVGYAYTSTPGPAYIVSRTIEVSKAYDLNGAFTNWSETSYADFDIYGQPRSVATTYKTDAGTPDGFSNTTTFTLLNDTSAWLLGLPEAITTTSRAPGYADSIRREVRSYRTANPGRGLLQQQVIEPYDGGGAPGFAGPTNLRLATDFTYDPFGNVLTQTVSGPEIATRTEIDVTYDAQGRFVMSLRNAIGQTESRTTYPQTGKLATQTLPDQTVTSWTYDEFGRLASEQRADGSVVTLDRKPCVNCFGRSAYAVYRTHTASNGTVTVSPSVRRYFDVLDRELLDVEPGLDGADIYHQTDYDAYGRASQRSLGFRAADTPRFFVHGHDALGRLTSVTAPDASVRRVYYSGRVRTTENENGVKSEKTFNSQLVVARVVDAKSTAQESTVTYGYDNWRNLSKITDQLGNVTNISYDLRGRRTEINDPDLGVRKFAVDNLGQVVSSVDAKQQTTTYAYDLLGRLTRRTEPDLDSRWYFDLYANGLACGSGAGKLCEATASSGYARKNTFDTAGRLTGQTVQLDVPYTSAWEYDTAGRLSTVTYPASTASPLKLRYTYTSNGTFKSISNNATGLVYWSRETESADRQTTKELLGSSTVSERQYHASKLRPVSITAGTTGAPSSAQNHTYQYDAIGRLAERSDAVTGYRETFGYDALDRLTSASISASGVTGTQTTSISYNSIGNILSKTGLGTYTYPPAGAPRPHAVQSISGSVNGVAGVSYSYDANGNVMSNGIRHFTWTSFDMPATIAKVTQSTPGSGTATFSYGPEHQRGRQLWTEPSRTVDTFYIPNPGFEKSTDSSTGVTTYRHNVYAEGRLVGIVTRTSAGSETTFHAVTDELGSVSVVAGTSGSVADRFAYDAWGDRRVASGSATGASDPLNSIQPTTTNRGFTGHEMLDRGNMGLVHMNARVYDPTVSIFTSPDKLVQAPYSSQSLNRYSYVWNDPLNATDPSGERAVDEQLDYFGYLHDPRIGPAGSQGPSAQAMVAQPLPPVEIIGEKYGRDPFVRSSSTFVVPIYGLGRPATVLGLRPIITLPITQIRVPSGTPGKLPSLVITGSPGKTMVVNPLLAFMLTSIVVVEWGSNLMFSEASKTVDDLISESKPGERKRWAIQWIHPGGREQAEKDFDALGATGVKVRDNGTRTGTLPDGRPVNIHDSEEGGVRTIEIQEGSRRSIKIRYP